MPELKKAELLEGVVYRPSPVRFSRHSSPHLSLITWIGVYQAHTPGVLGGDNATIRLDLDNEPQPDSLLIIDPAFGGDARISQDDYLEGGPEWVGEVAASSVSYDLHAKLRVYRRNQVKEYLVWRVNDRALDWFMLRNQEYEPLVAGPDGYLRSLVFPGLWLDPVALVDNNLAGVLAVLQQGLASKEHEEFVQMLASRRRPGESKT